MRLLVHFDEFRKDSIPSIRFSAQSVTGVIYPCSDFVGLGASRFPFNGVLLPIVNDAMRNGNPIDACYKQRMNCRFHRCVWHWQSKRALEAYPVWSFGMLDLKLDERLTEQVRMTKTPVRGSATLIVLSIHTTSASAYSMHVWFYRRHPFRTSHTPVLHSQCHSRDSISKHKYTQMAHSEDPNTVMGVKKCSAMQWSDLCVVRTICNL